MAKKATSSPQRSTPKVAAWTKKALYQHLQMAIDVEFFTIPLYLTAAYSIRPENRTSLQVEVNGEDSSGKPLSATYNVYELVLSVAIQEMYHLMWACNIAKSVGMTINIQAPDMTKLPATLNLPSKIASKYKGVANLADVIDLLVAIETPDPKYDYPADPSHPITDFKGPTSPQASYDSIGDLYHAIAYGLKALFPKLNQLSYKNYQKQMISSNYPKIPFVTDLSSALTVIGAIVEQGEGTGVEGFIPGDYDPQDEAYKDQDRFTHYERFVAIQKNIATIKSGLYPTPKSVDPNSPTQQDLAKSYSLLLTAMNTSYTWPNATLETLGMSEVGLAVSKLWAEKQKPLWQYTTDITIPALELHVCQGLNTCAGHGVNLSGTMPGNGDCATVNHVCQGSNDCRGQGACGYPGQAKVNGPLDQFVPGENDCAGLGGCQSPISVWQMYSGGDNNPLNGTYVWCEARKLFEAKMKAQNREFGTPNPTPTAVRIGKGTNPNKAHGPLKDNTSCPT